MSLQGYKCRLENQAYASALAAQDEDNGDDGRVACEDAGKCCTEGPKEKAGPDDFAIALATGNVLARGNGKGHLGKGNGEDEGGSYNGGELKSVFVEEGEVVELGIVDYAEKDILQQKHADRWVFVHGHWHRLLVHPAER